MGGYLLHPLEGGGVFSARCLGDRAYFYLAFLVTAGFDFHLVVEDCLVFGTQGLVVAVLLRIGGLLDIDGQDGEDVLSFSPPSQPSLVKGEGVLLAA